MRSAPTALLTAVLPEVGFLYRDSLRTVDAVIEPVTRLAELSSGRPAVYLSPGTCRAGLCNGHRAHVETKYNVYQRLMASLCGLSDVKAARGIDGITMRDRHRRGGIFKVRAGGCIHHGP